MKQKLLYIFFITLLFQTSFSQSINLDTTFGTNGKVIYPTITSGQTIQLQSDGKIVSCYLGNFSISGNVRLARFNVDGSIDTTFGTNGYVITTIVNESGPLNMMKLQSNGKILVTGFVSSNGGNNASYFDFCTARFNSDGTLDTSFGTNGYAITGFGNSSYDEGSAIEIQNDGKILVAGHSSQNYLVSSNYSPDFAVVRYLSDGTLDTTFGINGKFTYNFGTHTVPTSGLYSADYVSSIEINSVGKVVMCGSTTVNESNEDINKFGFICLNADGTLDTSFGSNGQRTVSFGEGWASNCKLANDDKIIATGTYRYTPDGINNYLKIGLVKLLANGDLDSGFGNNGILLTNRNSSNLRDASSDFNILPNNKIICIGATVNDGLTHADFLLIRFNANGTIDSSFNGTGYRTVDFDNSNTYANSFLIQPDGKFICAGSIDYSIGCLARLEANDLSTGSFTGKSFSAYPNPFSETITIDRKDLSLEGATVGLYDIQGRELADFEINAGNSTLTIGSGLSKGNYFLKVTSGLKTETIKIVKQ
jgi:uncharacterized delta-60 repeat protein